MVSAGVHSVCQGMKSLVFDRAVWLCVSSWLFMFEEWTNLQTEVYDQVWFLQLQGLSHVSVCVTLLKRAIHESSSSKIKSSAIRMLIQCIRRLYVKLITSSAPRLVDRFTWQNNKTSIKVALPGANQKILYLGKTVHWVQNS